MIAAALLMAGAISNLPVKMVPQEARYSLIDCDFHQIDFKAMAPIGEAHHFAMLFPSPEKNGDPVAGDKLKIFDPTNLLMGLGVDGAFFTADGKMLFMQTNPALPSFFRLSLSSRSSGKWAGGLGLNGKGTKEEHMAHSFMGDCSITHPIDAPARFEAFR